MIPINACCDDLSFDINHYCSMVNMDSKGNVPMCVNGTKAGHTLTR